VLKHATNHTQTRCVQFEKHFINIPIFGIFEVNSYQMNKNTSISLGNYFDQFVQTSISEGRFKNVSEVIRAGLRLLEEEESKVIALKKAIQEGVDSGIANDFDPKKHLESLKAKKHSNG
jgi:antitoxin ParD1/3/4